MLIAPIFHNSYLSPNRSDSQNKSSDGVSNSSSSTKASEASVSKQYNNIFKTAFNRSISFLSKITNNNSSGSNTPSTSVSVSSKPAESDKNHESSSSDTPSDCSSPDSLKTEMIFFKPITREPRTPSSAKPALLRVPSIRSAASSTDRQITSPCPSPFFIPITPRRQSAFTFVASAETQTIVKPRPTKRRNVKSSPDKTETSPKRQKRESRVNVDKKLKAVETKTENVVTRKTRSMDKNEEEILIKTKPKELKSKTPEKRKVPVKKSPPKKEKPVESLRVLRSRSMKN